MAEFHEGDVVLRSVEVLRVQPGDVVLVTVEDRLPTDRFDEFGQRLKEQWPDNKVVLLESGAEVRVVRGVSD